LEFLLEEEEALGELGLQQHKQEEELAGLDLHGLLEILVLLAEVEVVGGLITRIILHLRQEEQEEEDEGPETLLHLLFHCRELQILAVEVVMELMILLCMEKMVGLAL
jgi:hypothetical protein